MEVEYLEIPIIAKEQTLVPAYGMAASGYTLASGAPTSMLVMLQGEKRWRRLMVVCFSNVGSLFLNIRGKRLYVHEYMIPE